MDIKEMRACPCYQTSYKPLRYGYEGIARPQRPGLPRAERMRPHFGYLIAAGRKIR